MAEVGRPAVATSAGPLTLARSPSIHYFVTIYSLLGASAELSSCDFFFWYPAIARAPYAFNRMLAFTSSCVFFSLGTYQRLYRLQSLTFSCEFATASLFVSFHTYCSVPTYSCGGSILCIPITLSSVKLCTHSSQLHTCSSVATFAFPLHAPFSIHTITHPLCYM